LYIMRFSRLQLIFSFYNKIIMQFSTPYFSKSLKDIILFILPFNHRL
jgi:hypothetical protein